MIISPIKNKIKFENKDFYNLRLIEMSGIEKVKNKNLINFTSDNNDNNDDYISFNRELLHNNTNLLLKNISLIIKSYKNEIISDFYTCIKINTLTLDGINIFLGKLYYTKFSSDVLYWAPHILRKKKNYTNPPVPYLPPPQK